MFDIREWDVFEVYFYDSKFWFQKYYSHHSICWLAFKTAFESCYVYLYQRQRIKIGKYFLCYIYSSYIIKY